MFGNWAAQSASTVHFLQSATVMVWMDVAHRVEPSTPRAQTHNSCALHWMKSAEAQLSVPGAQVPCPTTQIPRSREPQRCPDAQQTAPHARSAGQQLPPMHVSPAAQQAAPHV
jgi:hypothetical protein